MYLMSKQKSECCGCGVCVQVCPRKCITLGQDEDGFLVPEVDNSQCIHCHLCEKVCPIENIPKNHEAEDGQVLIAARHKSSQEVKKSASGGAFGAIVHMLRNTEEWMVWGAALDEELQVKHICSENEDDLDALRKSKYVQSNTVNIYPEIKKQLVDGKKVLFSGTPCQVAAVRNYLKSIDTKNLVCVDLVCHGVPNQKMLDAYCKEEEQHFNSEIQNIEFRYKRYDKFHKRWNSRNLKIMTKDGKMHIRNRYNSSFLRAYYSFIFSRESCHSCLFATPVRQGDITVADFWGIQRFYPGLNAEQGISLIQANTRKGKEILKGLSGEMDIYEIDREKYLAITNGAMVTKTPKNKNRESFLQYAREHSFTDSVNRFVPKYKELIKIEIARRISPEMRKKIKKVLRK